MKTVIISLGGSLIVPDEIDYMFLKEFRKIILGFIKKGNRAVLIAGGGKTCRKYNEAAEKIIKVPAEDLDWLGIHATRLNAQLLRTIFKEQSYEKVIHDPTEAIETEKPVIIGCGWKPGCSTDFDAVKLAKTLDVKTLINMSNIDHVYDKDPKKAADAKPLKSLSWDGLKKLVGSEWKPGMNAPFDPIATKEAAALKMQVIIIGKDLENLKNVLEGKPFEGTIIS